MFGPRRYDGTTGGSPGGEPGGQRLPAGSSRSQFVSTAYPATTVSVPVYVPGAAQCPRAMAVVLVFGTVKIGS